jgi:hypothetical protein
MLEREKTRVRKNSCLTTRAPYKAVARDQRNTNGELASGFVAGVSHVPPLRALALGTSGRGGSMRTLRGPNKRIEKKERKRMKIPLDNECPIQGFWTPA